jgi:hypothetical protein
METEETILSVLTIILRLWPLWLTGGLVLLGFNKWMQYINRRFIEDIDWVMLEVKIPKDIDKTPLAMELALGNALSQGGGVGTWVQKYVTGNLVNWFSLELVSIDGAVKFFIRTPRKFKGVIETQIYSQYSAIEIYEVDDYTTETMESMRKEEWSLFGSDIVLSGIDPLPIKTYVDYPAEIDPITPVIEFLGSLGQDEQVWIQIMVRSTQERFHKPGTWFKKQDWRAEGENEIKKLKTKYALKEGENIGELTQAEKESIQAIEKNISKVGFDVGIRGLYLAKKDTFDPTRIAGLMGVWKQYNSMNANGFKPANATDFAYPWQDRSGKKLLLKKREIFDAYIRRSYFYDPYPSKPFVLNAEELATIYHFPGGIAETPTLKRIESKKAEPPVNLPM